MSSDSWWSAQPVDSVTMKCLQWWFAVISCRGHASTVQVFQHRAHAVQSCEVRTHQKSLLSPTYLRADSPHGVLYALQERHIIEKLIVRKTCVLQRHCRSAIAVRRTVQGDHPPSYRRKRRRMSRSVSWQP